MSLNTTLQCGAPHFKSIAKQHRHANYNLEKALNEFIDNIIKLANCIHITTEVDGEGRLQELKVSDDYALGFVNISEQGINNPFNMGHIKSGHDDDSETSEFGCGSKAAALSASNHLAVVTRSNGHYYEVICDFIKMAKEEDVNASYNPKKREISLADFKDIHPFETGSSIILSKMLGTICEHTTQQKLTDRLKKGISETYSRFLKEGLDIRVNGEPVKEEIDFFVDTKCEPFTIKKSLYILEKPGTNDKIYLIQKTVERATWQIYNKIDDKWEAFRSGKDADDFKELKRKEGYTFAYPQQDNSCMKLETVFVFYSDLVHTDELFEHLLPQDQVLIYKDNRKYGKKSLVKHNDGNNNYTLHRIEFCSKKIGKELGITFNKDITMEGNNDLIVAVKSAIKDSRKEYNANTATDINKRLCEKAIKLEVIDLMTCRKVKLSSFHRDKRMDEENKFAFKTPKPLALPVTKHVTQCFQSDDESSDYSSSDSESESESVYKPESESVILTKSDTGSGSGSGSDTDEEESVSNTDTKDFDESKAILIKAAKMIMDITAADDFNICLKNSVNILDIVQQMLNL